VVVSPGDVDASTSLTTITPPQTVTAGMTYFFTITTKDMYGNLRTVNDADTEVEIIAEYINHAAWPSPIGVADLTNWQEIYGEDIAGVAENNDDGTFRGQITVYRAGTFTLHVRINNEDVISSPFSNGLLIEPSLLYAPNSIVSGFSTVAVAGTASTFEIQGRDFYSNNLQVLIASETDKAVKLVDQDGTTVLTGTIIDKAAQNGVYTVSYTPTIAGTYYLNVTLNDLPFDQAPYQVTVDPAATTSAATSTISAIPSSFTSGDQLIFLIEARDAYGNLRPASTAETFVVTITGSPSASTFSPVPVSNGNGTYTVTHTFTTAETY